MAKKSNEQIMLLKKFPSPREDAVFVARWRLLLPQVTQRENFKHGHLLQLEILCALFAEFENLTNALELTGYTYVSEGGRYGTIHKTYPEVSQLNQTRAQIAVYCKMLGVVLVKDTASADPAEEEEWE